MFNGIHHSCAEHLVLKKRVCVILVLKLGLRAVTDIGRQGGKAGDCEFGIYLFFGVGTVNG